MPNLRLKAIERNGAAIPGSFTPEGFGKNATGGEGYSIYTVTTGNATGPGSFDNAFVNGCYNKIIQFDPSVTSFDTQGSNYTIGGNVTIDGLRNGCTGVIKNGVVTARTGLNPKAATNVIIRGINFRGNASLGVAAQDSDGIGLSGDAGPNTNILIDRCTFAEASDGCIDITNGNSYVTVQWCLFYDSTVAMLIKYGSQDHISIHHNVFAHGSERNPQIRGDQNLVEFVNNVVMQNGSNPSYPADFVNMTYFDGEAASPFGLRIINSASLDAPGDVVCNIVGNAYLGDYAYWDLITETGRSNAGNYWGSHGTGATNNYWDPSSIIPGASPRETPNTIPPGYEITTMSITSLATQMVPYVGCPRKTGNDQARINTVISYMP